MAEPTSRSHNLRSRKTRRKARGDSETETATDNSLNSTSESLRNQPPTPSHHEAYPWIITFLNIEQFLMGMLKDINLRSPEYSSCNNKQNLNRHYVKKLINLLYSVHIK